MELLQTKYTNMTLQSFIINFSNSIKCYFACPNCDINSYYYDLDEEVEIIMENIALFQNAHNAYKTRKFLYHVYYIAEKIIPKVNCMLIELDPNAGKNMFLT